MTAAVDAQAYCGACRVRAPVRFAACTLSQLCLSDLRDFTLLLSLFRRGNKLAVVPGRPSLIYVAE